MQHQAEESNARLGLLVHELRNSLHSATLALTALESGTLPVGGSTGGVLKRSLQAMAALLTRAVEEVRAKAATPSQRATFSLAVFVAEAESVALLHATARGCALVVHPADPLLKVHGNRELLMAALVNLLHNALKFTRPNTSISLTVRATESLVYLDVEDCCGGLAVGSMELMFRPFTQRNEDRSGLGLGLSIARRYVEADGGTVAVHNLPGKGCVFTMSIPRDTMP